MNRYQVCFSLLETDADEVNSIEMVQNRAPEQNEGKVKVLESILTIFCY